MGYLFFKRLFDIVFSSMGILFLSPVMLIIAFCIVLTDGFPILFKNERVGLRGKRFYIYKFRSMRLTKNTDITADIGASNRITPIGKYIRKTKLDILPQLFNVLKGEMSVIGVKPELTAWLDTYPERWANVHSVKPAMFDMASLVHWDESLRLQQTTNPQKLYAEEILPQKLDLYDIYVKKQSMRYDIYILLCTIGSTIGIKRSK